MRVSGHAIAALLFLCSAPLRAEGLKPYVLGETPPGDAATVQQAIKDKLSRASFEVVGTYSPYSTATVIAFTSDELKAAAANGAHGGYASVLRVGVTDVGGKIQVAWNNPLYIAASYRRPDDLSSVRQKLEAALGSKQDFGSKDGMDPTKLRKYHFMIGMEYFDSESKNLIKSYGSHAEAVDAVEKGLAAGAGGVKKVYRVEIPGTEQTVFGVALGEGDGSDTRVMGVTDKGELKMTPYLPYEILVDGKDVMHLYMSFRTAIAFPDLTMKTFMKLGMGCPKATKASLASMLENKGPAK